MSLLDKYGVVISPEIGQNADSSCKDMNYYFENLIKNNNKVYLTPYIIRQINDDNIAEVEGIIYNFLNDEVKTIRSNLRNSIRRKKFVNIIEAFISLINNFSNKVYELEYFSRSSDFKKKCFRQFFNTIIVDPITTSIFSRDVMDLNIKGKTRYLLSKIKNIDEDFHKDWCTSFISTSIDDICKSEQNFDYPIPKNLEPLYVFSKLSNFLTKYSKHFNFLTDSSIFKNCYSNLLQKIIELSERNTLETLACFFDNEYNKGIIHKVFSQLNNFSNDLDKEDFQMKLIVNVLDNFKKDENLFELCSMYVCFYKNYPNILGSMNALLTKEIAKIICDKNLYDDINAILIDMIKSEETDNLNYIFTIIGNIDDKNICYKKYHQELMLRIQSVQVNKKLEKSQKIDSFEYEISIVENFKRCFTPSQRYRLIKTVEDMKKSVEFNGYIQNIIENKDELKDDCNFNFNIINTSYNIWDTVVMDVGSFLDEIDSGYPIAKFIKVYSNIYKKSHVDTRYLNWYLHTGSVNINYATNNGTIFLKLLPVQALILERFDFNVSYVKVETFLSFEFLKSYERKEKEKMLDIFIDSEILKISEDKISLNLDIPDYQEEIDLITPYFEVSSIIEDWDEKVANEIANNKIDVVKCKINHHLKLESLDYDKLFDLCSSINVFQLDKKLFDDSLKYMINHDFIEHKDTVYSKLLY